MAKINQYDSGLVAVSEKDIDVDSISPKVTPQLIHDACVMYHANQRVGTMGSRSRSDVAGTTAKMYRQKGTGRARAGSRRSPVRRGGGHTFAKRPRDFSYSMPRKSLQAATRMSLRLKVEAGEVIVVESIPLPGLKTKHVAAAVKKLGIDGSTCLLVTAEVDQDLNRCVRNIPNVRLVPVSDLNASLLMRHRMVVFVGQALDRLAG